MEELGWVSTPSEPQSLAQAEFSITQFDIVADGIYRVGEI
jgi:hypothetical protein